MIVITAVSATVLRTFQFNRFVWQVIRKPFDLDDLIGAVFDCMACHSGHRPSNAGAFSRWFGRRSAGLGARAGLVSVAREQMLHVRSEFGFAAGATQEFFPLPFDRKYPLSTAYRTGRPVWLASLTVGRAEYPLLLPIWTSNGSQAIAALPIMAVNQPIGAIGWSFDEPQAFESDHREALGRLGSECSILLNRGSADQTILTAS